MALDNNHWCQSSERTLHHFAQRDQHRIIAKRLTHRIVLFLKLRFRCRSCRSFLNSLLPWPGEHVSWFLSPPVFLRGFRVQLKLVPWVFSEIAYVLSGKSWMDKCSVSWLAKLVRDFYCQCVSGLVVETVTYAVFRYGSWGWSVAQKCVHTVSG